MLFEQIPKNLQTISSNWQADQSIVNGKLKMADYSLKSAKRLEFCEKRVFDFFRWQVASNFREKRRGFKKVKSGRNGACNLQQNKNPEKGDYKKVAFNEKKSKSN